MVMRGAYYALGPRHMAWLLLFADDGKMVMPMWGFRQMIPIVFAFFAVFGLPIKWPQVRGGVQFQ